MAAATITKTEYGFSVTGGTDATTVYTGKMWVKGIGFAGNADNATAALTSVPTNDPAATTSCMKFKTNGNDLDTPANYLYFGDNGIPLNNLGVTLSATTDVLYVYLKF